jgi:hypothetical protein
MAAIDPSRDPRGARWEARLRLPVLAAAWLAVPTVFLYFSALESGWGILAVVLSWAIWLVFMGEAAIMLSVVRDRRAWIRGHLFGLAILCATFPLLTKALEALLAARALSSLQAIRLLQVLYLAKAAKLVKGLLIVRRSGGAPQNPVLRTAVGVLLAVVLIGIGYRIVSGDKHATPLHASWALLAEFPVWSLAVAAAGFLALLAAGFTGPKRRGASRSGAAASESSLP